MFVCFTGWQADDEGMDRLQGSLVQAAIKRLVKEFKSKVCCVRSGEAKPHKFPVPNVFCRPSGGLIFPRQSFPPPLS